MMRHSLRVLVMLLMAAVARAAPDPPPLFYAVISDTQKPDGDPLTDFRWGIAQVNAIAPDFLLMPGDLTNTGTVAQYQNVMSVTAGCQVPVYYAIGNHDAVPGEGLYRRRYTGYTGAAPWYHARIGGWHLVVLDSVRFADGKLAHDGVVAAEQFAWLRNELARIGPDEPIILVEHHPFAIRADGLSNASEVLALLDDRWLVYTVAGHFHRNHHTQDLNAIHHFVTASLSFSTDKKNCGIGYRLFSTVGRDLWTAWVETTDPPALRQLAEVGLKGEIKEQTDAPLPGATTDRLVLRVKYRGGPAGLAVGPRTSPRQLIELPAVAEEATALVPLGSRETAPLAGGEPVVRLTPGGVTMVAEAIVYDSPADWQHYRLRAPGETKAEVTLHAPADGGKLPRGVHPILAVVRARERDAAVLTIDGDTVTPDPSGYVAALFRANGLQSRSYRFINSLYANGELVTRLCPERDVTQWEQLAYAIPRAIWSTDAEPSLKLTAGTTTDGSGANPPENNEDYLVQDVVLFDGANYWRDPHYPRAKAILIGDNKDSSKTVAEFRPAEPYDPDPLRVLLHTWDTRDLKPGKHTIAVSVGGQTATATVELE